MYISPQSILKQGFQKTNFPMLLKLKTFFAVDLGNFKHGFSGTWIWQF